MLQMDGKMPTINRERFLDLLEKQSQFGATPAGGVSRPALSAEDIQIRAWFKQVLEAHGLEYAIDGAGNQSGRLLSTQANAKTLLLGSHFDSVPNGGRFDGALGVIAALEVALSIQDAGSSLPFHLEVLNFTDEEGTLLGLTGSRALIGQLGSAELQNPRCGRDHLVAGMERAGLTDAGLLSAKRDPHTLLGYLETHIEQGTRLEEAGLHIGIVTSIVGIRSYWLTFKGAAAHAGTQPMNQRRDAFWGAAAFALQARKIIMADFHPGVVNFGQIQLLPGAFNIVPNEVRLGMEFRHGAVAQLDNMATVLLELAQRIAAEYNLELAAERGDSLPPAPMSAAFVTALETAADKLGLTHTRLLSFAGHDAQSLAQVTQSAMFFVPSVGGISHNPQELTHADDCVNAANVLLHAVLEIARYQA
jgi:beta-ureidopropionase / N-carbamoyl-L-amino-acid hydrolase